jgi:hypothetical protein
MVWKFIMVVILVNFKFILLKRIQGQAPLPCAPCLLVWGYCWGWRYSLFYLGTSILALEHGQWLFRKETKFIILENCSSPYWGWSLGSDHKSFSFCSYYLFPFSFFVYILMHPSLFLPLLLQLMRYSLRLVYLSFLLLVSCIGIESLAHFFIDVLG